MKKIVFVKEALPGGTENYCLGLYEFFRDDHDISVMPVERIPQIQSHYAHYHYDKNVLLDHIKDADIVHINGYTAQGTVDAFKLAHKLGKKIVYTAHFHPFQYLVHPFLGKLFFNFRVKPLIQKYASAVTTINDEDTAFFSAIHPNVVKIPHWDRTLPSHADHTAVEKEPRMILFVGRINDPVKNFSQVFALEEGKYDIHCVGKGELQTKRGDITQHEDISDAELSMLYRRASLLVAPSKYEAFSYVALEALSVGTPVVMSDRVRIADHLDGVRGYSVYNYGDSQEFVNLVESTIGMSVDTEEVKHRFNPETISRKYKQLYLSI